MKITGFTPKKEACIFYLHLNATLWQLSCHGKPAGTQLVNISYNYHSLWIYKYRHSACFQ